MTQSKSVFEHFKDRPCILELGCGNGHFLSEYLLTKSGTIGLGVDRRFKRLFKTAQKFGPDSQSRVFFGDAPSLLQESPEQFWNEIWMQFPDPWPKAKHCKNRMLDEILIQNIFRALRPGGFFGFISDHHEYWLELRQWQEAERRFQAAEFKEGDLFSDLPSSLFKKTMLRLAKPLYSARLSKAKEI
jgi:tRNA (guanine-N7-)-methyltransferase